MESLLTRPIVASIGAGLLALAICGIALRLVHLDGRGAARERAMLGVGLLLLCLPPILSLVPAHVRIFSYHGLMHASIVYQLVEGVVPPGDPFFGGEPLRYAWAHHALMAALVRGLDVGPPSAFAMFNVAALLAFVAGSLALARRLSCDRMAWLLIVLSSLYGVAIFSRGPLAVGITALGLAQTDVALLAVEKFVHVNSNQAGLVCFVFGLLGVIIVAEGGRAARGWVALALAVLGAALLYPLVWLPLCACVGASALLLWRGGQLSTRRLGGIAACGAVASALALPYLIQIQTGREQRALSLSFELAHAARNGTNLLLTLAPALVLMALRRREMGALAVDAPIAVRVLAISVVVNAVAYLGLHAPTHSEYKLLALSALSLAPLAGVALASLLRSRPSLATVAIGLALLPAAHHLHEMVSTPLGDVTQVVEDGALLQRVDPETNALCEWIRTETPPGSVVVDTTLVLPPFAHRSLYLAYDPRPTDPRRAALLAGFDLPPSTWLLTSLGRSPEALEERHAVVQGLFGRRGAMPLDLAVEALRDAAGASPVYVVTRSRAARRRFLSDGRFEPGFRAGEVAVLRLASAGTE